MLTSKNCKSYRTLLCTLLLAEHETETLNSCMKKKCPFNGHLRLKLFNLNNQLKHKHTFYVISMHIQINLET